MSTTARLDSQINKATYLSAIILFVFTAVSMFGVYDAPAGSTAAEKVAWLNENNGAFVLSWVTQIVQVFTLTTIFAAACWKVFSVNPLAAVSGGIILMLGTMAILITKGTELWIVPLAAQDLAAGSASQEPGLTLLSINSQSYPYSLTNLLRLPGALALVAVRPTGRPPTVPLLNQRKGRRCQSGPLRYCLSHLLRLSGHRCNPSGRHHRLQYLHAAGMGWGICNGNLLSWGIQKAHKHGISRRRCARFSQRLANY